MHPIIWLLSFIPRSHFACQALQVMRLAGSIDSSLPSVQAHLQGYGAVDPVMGMTALFSAIVGSFAPADVVVNPFDWARFLSGAEFA